MDDIALLCSCLCFRLLRFDKNSWRMSYKALIVLEHLLTHGPESVAEEFQSDQNCISEMGSFQHIDEKGFNWGMNVRKKSERLLKLLEKGPEWKEERNRSRKITRGIQGFGSFCQRTTFGQEILEDPSLKTYGRSNSQFNDHGNQEDQFSPWNDQNLAKTRPGRAKQIHGENVSSVFSKKVEDLNYLDSFTDHQKVENFGSRGSFKEDMAPRKEVLSGDLEEWNYTGESNPLLDDQRNDPGIGNSVEEDHPFNDTEHLSNVSLLSSADQLLQAY
ncbi:unnamed protein product [Ilex paraguariensis]|uniref:ENTH domain-containing protein n=1 Tax=Ilex paraguariensis TaxID=185542 RepID=A0ABC8V4K6_9AQUA